MKLEDLETLPHPEGSAYRALFDNGYGISVVPDVTIDEQPLYEVAVLTHNKGRQVRLTYESGITNDVIRWCTENAVNALIESIQNLPNKDNGNN